MKNGKLAVFGRMNIELDDVGAVLEGRPHGGNRVLEIRMLRRMDAVGGTGFIGDALDREGMTQAAVGEQDRLPPGRFRQERAVVEVEEDQQEKKDEPFFSPFCEVPNPLIKRVHTGPPHRN